MVHPKTLLLLPLLVAAANGATLRSDNRDGDSDATTVLEQFQRGLGWAKDWGSNWGLGGDSPGNSGGGGKGQQQPVAVSTGGDGDMSQASLSTGGGDPRPQNNGHQQQQQQRVNDPVLDVPQAQPQNNNGGSAGVVVDDGGAASLVDPPGQNNPNNPNSNPSAFIVENGNDNIGLLAPPPNEDEDAGDTQYTPPPGCQTAFAFDPKKKRCFDVDGFKRWGWTNGPYYAPSSGTFQMIAGAGGCDEGKGTVVGTLEVTFDGTTCSGTYQPAKMYTFPTTHFYCGDSRYPQKQTGQGGDTVSLGLYPFTGPDLSYSATIGAGFDSVYFIAHADSCQKPIKDQVAPPPDVDPYSWGDPHFRTFHGVNEFEYHGECDMVLLKAPALDMDIHIRTTVRYDYSFISQVAVRMGEDIFEVDSWAEYRLNDMSSIDLPTTLESTGYQVTMTPINKKRKHFFIHLGGDGQEIAIVSFKEYISIKIEKGTQEMFHGSSGIMGDFETGSMMGRDGLTNMTDPRAYATEWQVRPEEDGVLFMTPRVPEYPHKCLEPDSDVHTLTGEAAEAVNKVIHRQLGERTVSHEEAEAACAHWKRERASCIEDVIKTGDVEIAELGEE